MVTSSVLDSADTPVVALVDRIPVIDTDTHVSEPPDLWLSRLPTKWHDIAPRVVQLDTGPDGSSEDVWLIGDDPVASAWRMAMAGWEELSYKSHPWVQSQADPASFDPVARLTQMDEHGISAQVLYPNLLAFYQGGLLRVGTPDFHVACVRAYNDFLSDFTAVAPQRYIPIAMLPFWDADASVAEIERCAEMGHKGLLFSSAPEKAGLPVLGDPYWNPVFGAAQAAGLSINFHVAVGTIDKELAESLEPGSGFKATPIEGVRGVVRSWLANANAIMEVILCGICDQFPELRFVSVESGYGYLPYLLDGLDWQWLNSGAKESHPGRLKPSEYFRRQMYATFWFEDETVKRLADLYPDNLMFESDFPHSTCLAPGPASYTDAPRVVLEDSFAGKLPDELLRKLLHDNAARVYNLG